MQNCNYLDFTGRDSMTALRAAIQLASVPKLYHRVEGAIGKGIVLYQDKKRALRLFTNLAYTFEENFSEDGYRSYEVDLSTLIIGINSQANISDFVPGGKGIQTIDFWEQKLGYNQPDDNKFDIMDDNSFMLWSPKFQITNASGFIIEDNIQSIPSDIKGFLEQYQPKNTIDDFYSSFCQAPPEANPVSTCVVRTWRFLDGSSVVVHLSGESLDKFQSAVFYAPSGSVINGKDHRNLSKKEFLALGLE